jgi:inner membrane protein
MMITTHLAIGTAATSLILGTSNPWFLLAAALSSQIPDLDTTRSIAGRCLYPLARFLESRYAHRTITHSIYAVIGVAIVTLPIGYFLSWKLWAAIPIGHLIGGALPDCFTKKGACIFYPDPRPVVVPGNPKARIISGSVGEYWILSGAIVLLIVSCNLSSSGGVTDQFGQLFFQDSGTAATTVRKHGSTNQIWVDVEGTNVATSKRIKGRYEVLDAAGQDLTVIDTDKNLLKVGISGQIKSSVVKVKVGDRLAVSSRELVVTEQAIGDWVRSLPQNGYVTGAIKVEDAEDVVFPKSLQYLEPVTGNSSDVVLDHARPDQIKKVLGDSWVLSGKVVVKVREK